MFGTASRGFLFFQSCSPFLHLLHFFFYPLPLPITEPPKDVNWGPNWGQILSKSPQLSEIPSFPLGSPSRCKSNLLSSCCSLSPCT